MRILSSGLIIPTSAGVPVDSPDDGAIKIDTANDDLYFRSQSAWRSVNVLAMAHMAGVRVSASLFV